MVGMRGALVASLVLLGVGALASAAGSPQPSSRSTPSMAVADRTVSQIAPPVAANPAPPAPAPPTAAPAPTGPAQPAWKIVPTSSLASSATASSGQPFFRGGVRSRVAATPSGPTLPRVVTPSGPVLYNGLNQPGLTAAGIPATPPDSTGAIGPSNYVEMVNSRIAVYNRSLQLQSSATLDQLLGVASTPYCDVQIQWDPTANRWLFAFLMCGAPSGPQGFVVGWSRTSDPTTLSPAGWCAFGIGTSPDLFDYPKLGHNSNFLIVGGNFYDMSQMTQPFVGSGLSWFGLPAVGDTSCGVPSFQHTASALVDGDATTLAFTPVPVNTITAATDGYILAAYDPGGNVISPRAQSRLAAWHIDSAGNLHQDADIIVSSYSFPGAAPQKTPATTVIDTLDGRLTQAVGDPVSGIWTQHTVARTAGGQSVVDWYKISASGSVTNLADLGTISSSDWVFNAAISPRFDGQGAAIEYNRSSTATNPVIAAQIRLASTPAGQMEPGEIVLATSPATDTDFSCTAPFGPPCRWGDYSGATPDPVHTNVVWGTSEFVTASTVNPPSWSDENFALLVAIKPQAPTAVTATASDQSARVSWTPSAFDPGDPTAAYTITAYVGVTPGPTMTVAAPATAAIFRGLTNGVTYTFTVIANNGVGASPESPHSNTVTPTRAVQQVPMAPIGSRSGANQSTGGSPGLR